MKSRAKQIALEKLTSIHQEHLLQFWDQLPTYRQENLLRQIADLDLAVFNAEKKALHQGSDEKKVNLEEFKGCFSDEKEYEEIGKEWVVSGKTACLVLAGGQGSRLHFEGPKGCYPVSLVRNKSLFQLIAERVKAASQLAGIDLPIVIMTSPINMRETEVFFVQHNFFGLKPAQVSFFSQKMWPFLDFDENLFLDRPDQIASGPNGNGDVFARLLETGIYDKWKNAGIECVNVIMVDNPLALPFDFKLFGFHKKRGLDVSIKTAWRKDPNEKVGILVLKDQKPSVLEYTEIEKGTFTGKMCANLGLYAISLSFIKEASELFMPLHVVKKSVKKMGTNGDTEFPMTPNAWKFEKFFFDSLVVSKKCEAFLSSREDSFAPLKNLKGEDSIETVQAALLAFEKKLYTNVTGVSVPSSSVFELSPEFYYPTEQMLAKWKNRELPNQKYIEAS